MSITTKPDPLPQLPAPADMWRYGYREVPTQLPDGTTDFTRVPLTLEDVLHPQMGDVIVESNLNELIRRYLADVFDARTANDPGALVLSDVGVYWDIPGLRHHAPDVCVIFDVRDPKKYYPSFSVKEEGTRPRLIIEIASPDTRNLDVERKLRQYHRARVPYYVILDRVRESDPWTLIGYQRTPRKYLEMAKDEQGRLWLEPVGLWLGVAGAKATCYDGETDEEMGSYADVIATLATEKQRAEAEKQRADTAEARLRELEAELARLRGQNPAP